MVLIPMTRFGLTDLEIYYGKLSNAFNVLHLQEILIKSSLHQSKDLLHKDQNLKLLVHLLLIHYLSCPSYLVMVQHQVMLLQLQTTTPHGLSSGTPIKMKGVSEPDYNISTKVASVLTTTQFTYLLPFVRPNLQATPTSVASATITIETDTVTGASPYIFNVSLRSVFGMNGVLADGAKCNWI